MALLTVSFTTDAGTDPDQSEDAFLCDNNLFIVSEGVAGRHLDNIAREMACRVIHDAFFEHLGETRSPSDALHHAVEEANREILKEGKRIGRKMTVSICAAYIKDMILYFTHLGDSRIYCLQKGEILQLTRDHRVEREGLFFHPPKAYHTPHRNALTEALGLRNDPPVEVKKFALHEKDLILMTTEGLTSRLSDMQILKVFVKTGNVKQLCARLVHEARRVDKARSMTLGIIGLEKKAPHWHKIAALVCCLLILIGLAVVVLYV